MFILYIHSSMLGASPSSPASKREGNWEYCSPGAPTALQKTAPAQFSSFSCVWFFVTPWTAACQASLSITNSWSLLKLMCIESLMPSNHLILCRPLLLPTFNLSQHQGLFQWVSFCISWPNYWSFNFNISPTHEHPGLISFRMDWLDLLASDSQESSPTPQFKSINSSALCFLHNPTLTSIHDHRKNHSLDLTDLCWQSNVSAIEYAI